MLCVKIRAWSTGAFSSVITTCKLLEIIRIYSMSSEDLEGSIASGGDSSTSSGLGKFDFEKRQA